MPPSGQASSTPGARLEARTDRVTLDVAGDDCSGTVDLAVGDDWSFEDPARSRDTLYYQLPESGTTDLPVASVGVECSLEEPFSGAEASAVTWGDLEGYAEFVARTPGTTVSSTSFAGLPAISIARTRNGTSAHFVLAFTEGEAPARIVATTLVFSAEDDGDDVQAELDRVLATATALRLQP